VAEQQQQQQQQQSTSRARVWLVRSDWRWWLHLMPARPFGAVPMASARRSADRRCSVMPFDMALVALVAALLVLYIRSFLFSIIHFLSVAFSLSTTFFVVVMVHACGSFTCYSGRQ